MKSYTNTNSLAAQRLKSWLTENHITVGKLAKDLGVYYANAWKWTHGKHSPTLENMRKIKIYTDGFVKPGDWLEKASDEPHSSDNTST